MTEEEQYAVPPKELIDKYEGVFLNPDKDDMDIINYIWKNHGLCSYNNGLFWLINPDDYSEIARKFPDVDTKEIAFARTATGCLFTWDGSYVSHLNVHHGIHNVVASTFGVLFEWWLCADSFWKKECYGSKEFQVVKKFGPIDSSECIAYVPALALGGDESIKNMERVKTMEHLDLLSQLHTSSPG